jgi:general secretion pathway protein C
VPAKKLKGVTVEKRLPVSASFILVIALAVSLAYWALQLLKAPPRQLAAVPLQSAPPAALDAAASLFGGAATTIAVSNYQLRGVVAAERGGDSAAIIGVDGKPAVALAVGKDVVPGVTVQEIHPRYVLLSDGGVIKRIELATDNGKAAGLASPLPYVPAVQPAPPVQQPAPPVQQPAPPANAAANNAGNPPANNASGLNMPQVPGAANPK